MEDGRVKYVFWRACLLMMWVGMMACRENRVGEGCTYAMGALLMDADELVFDTVFLGQESSCWLRVYNPTKEEVSLEVMGDLEGFSVWRGEEQVGLGGVGLAAGMEDSLRVAFCPVRDTLLGNYFSMLHFLVDGEGAFGDGVFVKAYVADDFKDVKPGTLQPTVFVERDTVRFGRVMEGEKVKVAFKGMNRGRGVLRVRKVEMTCGCTTVHLERRVVNPGEEMLVEATFDTRGWPGFQRKRVLLYTNEARRPVVELVLEGMVGLEE